MYTLDKIATDIINKWDLISYGIDIDRGIISWMDMEDLIELPILEEYEEEEVV